MTKEEAINILNTAINTVISLIEELPSAQPRTKCIAEIKISKEDLDELVAEKVEKIKAAQPEIIYCEEIKAAQPEIIYCKDCKWGQANITPDGNKIYWVCEIWDGGTDADGYCYEAERRTDETNYRKE